MNIAVGKRYFSDCAYMRREKNPASLNSEPSHDTIRRNVLKFFKGTDGKTIMRHAVQRQLSDEREKGKDSMKTVLVTGVCGGMGRAICRRLLEKGYQVYGLDYKEGELPEGLHFVRCDVTDEQSVASAFERVRVSAGSLDAIVHTAGIYDLDSLLEMEEERFRRIFEVNLFGVYRVNKIFMPILNRKGRIVITTSELAPLDPLPFTGIYAVTKAALEKYAYSLRMEVGLLGISVSVLRPGAVNTGLLGDSTRALDRFCENTELYHCNAEKFKRIVDSVEAKNVPPETIAKTVCKALGASRPKYVYNVNRNFLLRLLNVLPDRMQTAIIRAILRT